MFLMANDEDLLVLKFGYCCLDFLTSSLPRLFCIKFMLRPQFHLISISIDQITLKDSNSPNVWSKTFRKICFILFININEFVNFYLL